jgi:hypothetical protein
MERRLMITEKSESVLSITKTPSSIARDYKWSKFAFLFFNTISIILIIASIKTNHVTIRDNLLLTIISLLFLFATGRNMINLRNNLKKGYTIMFDKINSSVTIKRNTRYNLTDINCIEIGPWYDTDNNYSGEGIQLKTVKGKIIVIESNIKEEADMRLAKVIADFINKPLIHVKEIQFS